MPVGEQRIAAANGSFSSGYTNVTAITVNKADQSISYSESSVTKHVNDTVFTNVLTQTTVYGAISYTSGNTAVATVDENTGEVTIVGAGTATITATAAGTVNYNQATASYTLTVTDHSYSSTVIAPTYTEQGYTTSAVTATRRITPPSVWLVQQLITKSGNTTDDKSR